MPSTKYDPDLGDTTPDELVSWVETQLKADSTLVGYLTAGLSLSKGDVFARHYVPEDIPEKLLVTRIRDQAGGVPQSFTGIERVWIQVMTLAAEEVPNRRQFFRQVAADVYSLIVGQTPSVSDQVLTPVSRARKQQEPRWDENWTRWFRTDTYYTIIRPS
jgi:hypothetical protein